MIASDQGRLAAKFRIDELSGDLQRELDEIARLAPQARRAGEQVVQGLRSSWRSFEFLDANTMIREFVDKTRGMTPPLKAQAAETMLATRRAGARGGDDG